jgi:GH24 family phage-related lysozyme (muramidase)
MRVHLKEMGVGIWKASIGGSVSMKNKSKFVAQREGKKNYALVLKPYQREHGTMHFCQGSMAKAREDISKKERRY